MTTEQKEEVKRLINKRKALKDHMEMRMIHGGGYYYFDREGESDRNMLNEIENKLLSILVNSLWVLKGGSNIESPFYIIEKFL